MLFPASVLYDVVKINVGSVSRWGKECVWNQSHSSLCLLSLIEKAEFASALRYQGLDEDTLPIRDARCNIWGLHL